MSRKVRHPKHVGVYTLEHRDGAVSYYIRYTVGRQVRTEKVGLDRDGYTARMAAQVRGERIRSLAHGDELPNKRDRLISLEEVFPLYIEDLKARGKDPVAMRAAWNNYIKEFAHVPIKSLSKIAVRKAMRRWCKSRQVASVNGTVAKLLTLVHWAIQENLYKGANPLAGLQKLPVNDKRDRWLTQEEARMLLAALRDVDRALHLQSLISLLTGARQGEVMQINTRNINWDAHTCFIPQTKAVAAGRHIFIGAVEELLGDYIEEHRIDGPLFPHIFKAALFKRVTDELKFNEGIREPRERFVFHSLRHTCASWMVQSGIDILTVSKVLGHKTVQHTMRYAHLAPDQEHAAVTQIGREFCVA